MPESKVEEKLDTITKRLDIIISVLMEQQGTEESTLRDKIRLLYDAGLDYKTIASILNKTPNHIAKELSVLKKSGKKRG